jgi:hypothetical protein
MVMVLNVYGGVGAAAGAISAMAAVAGEVRSEGCSDHKFTASYQVAIWCDDRASRTYHVEA